MAYEIILLQLGPVFHPKYPANITKILVSIFPKPELRGFWRDSLIKPPFKVTSAEVVIICLEL